MTTIHRSHFEGGIQSLSYTRADGVRVGIGVFQPGVYDVGNTDSEEHIQITSGSLMINGKNHSTGATLVAPIGTRLIFEAKEAATYLCTYHK